MSIKVVNAGSTAATGTYEASSELMFLRVEFSGNASFNLLDNTYKVSLMLHQYLCKAQQILLQH
jgi:hypothetical protein